MNLNLFATTVGKYHNPDIISNYIPVIDEYLSKIDTKMHGRIDNHKTTYNSELDYQFNEDSRLFGLFDYCINTTIQHFSEKGLDIQRIDLNPYFFVSEITSGGYFGIHTHPNCNFSGCLYIDCDESNADIIFHDPRPYYKTRILPRVNMENIHQFAVSPSIGDLYVWESWLEHEVDIEQSNRPRKTLVFNL